MIIINGSVNMSMVKIPFLPEFTELLLHEMKTATARTKKYGKTGDLFEHDVGMFQILSIEKKELQIIAHDHYKEEGFDNIEEFIICWNRIHPRKKYQPTQKVWFHKFRRVR